jgi:hypothetical protein
LPGLVALSVVEQSADRELERVHALDANPLAAPSEPATGVTDGPVAAAVVVPASVLCRGGGVGVRGAVGAGITAGHESGPPLVLARISARVHASIQALKC